MLSRVSPYSLAVVVIVSLMALAIAVPVLRMIARAFVVDGAFSPQAALSVLAAPWLPRVLLNTAIAIGASKIGRAHV